MAEVLCQIKKKGGGGGQKYTETSLWTNPSPSSNFAAQTVNLSDSISNYKYIAIDYKFYTGTSDTDKTRVIYPVDEFKKSLNNTGVNHIAAYFGIQNAVNGVYARRAYYNTDTSIGFLLSLQLGGSSSYSDQAIPLEIFGLNELDHGKNFDETTLWTNNAPTSAFANQTVALSDDIDNYDYIAFRYRNSTSVATENEVVYKVSNFKQLILANNTIHNTAGLVRQDASNNTFCRPFGYVSNTSVKFEACYRLYNASYNQTDCIPTSIVGYKFK